MQGRQDAAGVSAFLVRIARRAATIAENYGVRTGGELSGRENQNYLRDRFMRVRWLALRQNMEERCLPVPKPETQKYIFEKHGERQQVRTAVHDLKAR